jgi:hypothetical protein
MAAKFPCVFLLAVFLVLAQVEPFENKRIVDMQFTPVQPLDAAIGNLFASGRFEDAWNQRPDHSRADVGAHQLESRLRQKAMAS